MNGKLCFVHLENIFAIPYLHNYTQLTTADYDIVYWDRRSLQESCGAANHLAFHYLLSENSPKWHKLIGYLKFRKFARHILQANDYSVVIMLTSSVAVLLKDILLHKYSGRYILDIRDYFMENNRFYYNAEKKLIDNCGLTVISSPAYKRFLPEHNYLLVHNSPNLSDGQIQDFRERKNAQREKNTERPLVLSFIGGVRFFEQDKIILSYFANDDRFFIQYIGTGAELLRQHCEENNINNVYLHDRFPPDQTLNFYSDTDMILNLYGSGIPLLDYALSNKLYYAATLEIPILVCPNTYMQEVAVGNGLGVAVNLSDSSEKDSIYNYYKDIDWSAFHIKCCEFLARISNDNAAFDEQISRFLDI
ncbi:MAG: capsular biosynthesis protein [Sphaerochaeta sp.]|uniref:capsular polysaccharide biosynthesis protein Cps4G n=1 Tax=Sphaerochaeta sp. TaxID=1972642 RepID=UPI003D1363E5